jgi:hypothetical protein
VRITTPTLAILNQITGIYEEQAKLHARLMKKQLRGVITDIETINRQARMVAFNARIVAARWAGGQGVFGGRRRAVQHQRRDRRDGGRRAGSRLNPLRCTADAHR